MGAFATTAIVGVFLCVIGIINMKGNIASIHWYHRQRVTEEDRRPYGKLMGLGIILVGIAIMLFGILFLIYEKTMQQPYLIIGTVLMIVGIVTGLALSFYAMIKYNKGIF